MGNAGSAIWPKFSRGWQEFQSSDPLDYWTESVLQEIVARYDLNVIFPFEGPPYYPFRGAFLSTEVIRFSQDSGDSELCKSCVDKPCLSVCSVNAISIDNGYDADACRSHLGDDKEVECHTGCKARCVCPYGIECR